VSVLLLIGAFGLFELEIMTSGNENLARTIAVNTFVFSEMFYLFNCRSLTLSTWGLGLFSNRWLWGGVFIMAGLQVIFTYMPIFNSIFQSHPMSLRHWAMVLGYSALIMLVVAFEKYFRSMKNARSVKPSPSDDRLPS
jgi:Ca2+-transporting ATPase